MTNTAKILNFGRGNFAGQERNVADLDDGYRPDYACENPH